MQPPRPSPSSRRSWRDSRSAGPTPGSRTLGRWFFALLGVALIGYLAWLLWPHTAQHTHIAALPIFAQDKLTVPPLAFAQEDALGLGEVSSDKFAAWNDLQETAELDSLGPRLQNLTSQSQDVVILYVSAYGMSDNGDAYVLASDFLRRDGTGRYSVAKLLKQMKDCMAGRKLLVLDCGRLGSDPRLGILANEFPKLVEHELKQIQDPNLWVLLSNSSLQVTSTVGGSRKSVFGQSFTEALQGQADLPNKDVPEEGGNNDLKVSLPELDSYLSNRVADWYESDRSAAPMPLFMRAGKGLLSHEELPADFYLVMLPAGWNKPAAIEAKAEEKTSLLLSGQKNLLAAQAQLPVETPPAKAPVTPAAEAPAAETPAKTLETDGKQTPPPPAKKSAEKLPKEAEPAKKTAADTKPSAEEKKPVADEKASQQLRSQLELRASLDQAWQLRDKLQSRQTPGGWSPIDFAPHLWRELNALLLDYEQRCRAGEAFPATDLTRELDRLVGDLKQLDSQLQSGSAPSIQHAEDASVGTRLMDAWERFVGQPELLNSFTQAPPELDEVKQAVRFQADYVFAAEYYVRWHERSSLTSTEKIAQFDDLADLLKRLESYGKTLQSLEGKPFDPAGIPYLRQDRQQLEELRGRIDRRLFQDGDAASQALQQPLNERHVEDLLSTPLLSAERRKKLLDKLLGPERPLPRRVLYDAAKRPSGLGASATRWEQVLNRLDLERKLIRLFDPKMADELDSQFDATQLTAQNPNRDNELWIHYRQIGKRLQTYLASLPKVVEDLSRDSADDANTRRAELLLSLVDARDARSIPADLKWRPRLRVLPPAVAPRLAIQGPDELPLEMKKWRALKIIVEMSGQETEIVSTTIKYEAELLEIRAVDGGANIASGNRQLVTLNGDHRATLDWEVRAKTDRVDATKLQILAQAGQLTADRSIHCGLPKPNEIDLIAHRIGRTQQEIPAGQDGVQLRAFPNRTTAFRLSLFNRSGKAKKVKVELLSVPPQPAAKWAPGRLFALDGGLQPGIRRSLFDGADKLLPTAKVLATAKALSLPADAVPVEIDFTPPAPPTPKPGALPEAAAGAAPPPTPAPPAKPDVTQGLLCLLTNLEDPAERWLKWIELNPLQPKDYLDVEIGYDLKRERIGITLRPKILPGDSQPKPEEVLPIGLAENPIPILWDTTGELPIGSERNDKAKYDGGKPEVNLYAVVPPDEKEKKERIVRLTVDGYPRAFVYRVDCRETKQGEDMKPAREHVRINSVESPDFPRIYFFSPAAMPKEPPAGPAAKKLVLLEAGEAATIPAPCTALRIQFEVDVPKDAFQLSDRDDMVEVGLDVEGADRQRFYADRQVASRLNTVGPQGLLTLETEVRDYSMELNPGGLQNKRFQVTAQLVLAGNNVQGDRIPIVLDGLPPEIKTFSTTPDAGQQIAAGQKMVAHLHVTDLSGVAQVEFGFDLNQSGDLEKEEAKILQGLAQPPANDTWSLELSTKDLPPGRNVLMARAVDRVGLQSRPRPLIVRVASPDSGPGNGKAAKGTIRGVVMFGKLPADRIKVTLSLPGAGVQRTKDGGKFMFENVAEGEYTLQAEGSVQNVMRQGKLEKVAPSPVDMIEDVTLTLE